MGSLALLQTSGIVNFNNFIGHYPLKGTRELLEIMDNFRAEAGKEKGNYITSSCARKYGSNQKLMKNY